MACSSLSRWCVIRNTWYRYCLVAQKRYKYKKKWAVNLPSKSSCQLALDHFDAFYRPLYGRKWPSVRVSLLSLPKYAAVINNASEREDTFRSLVEFGAYDIVSLAAKESSAFVHGSLDRLVTSNNISSNKDIRPNSINSNLWTEKTSTDDDNIVIEKESLLSDSVRSESDLKKDPLRTAGSDSHNLSQGEKETDYATNMENVLTPDALMYSKNLEHFMPTEQVFSEKEQLAQEELRLSSYQERPVSVTVLPGQLPSLPASLQVMTYPAGDVSDFPKPRADKAGLLNYYLLDAASVLPVIALNIQPRDNVLDLCAAPGGKTMAMLQMIIAQGGHLTSNDVSPSRIHRLETVLRSYLSASLQSEFVKMRVRNGLHFREPIFSKVLVDVPCNSDRHVLLEEDNNLFKPGRIQERLNMTTLQKDLLLAGLRSCRPGGSVVYSTCTLAAVQNDGVVQAAVEELLETSDIDVAVEDLSPVADIFSQTFTFHRSARFGQLVLPRLTSNFGPMYFCKLRRLS